MSAVAVCCSSASESSRGRLHLVKQAHVLDCNHRLVCEGLDEIDLLSGEGINRDARQEQHADWSSSRMSGTPSAVRKPRASEHPEK